MPAIGSHGARGVAAIPAGGSWYSHASSAAVLPSANRSTRSLGGTVHAAAAPHVEHVHDDEIFAGLSSFGGTS